LNAARGGKRDGRINNPSYAHRGYNAAMDEQPFVEAIRAAPDDVTQRLIYADWLEERGDPLAELIRCEVERARISIFDPTYWDLKQRGGELRQQIDEPRRAVLGYGETYLPMLQSIPDSRMERWKRLDRFIDAWSARPLDRDSGVTMDEILAAEAQLGQRLPSAVREFYLLMGRRLEIGSHQDRFVSVEDLIRDHPGPMSFRYENQAVCRWELSHDINRDDEDPPVWCDEDWDRPHRPGHRPSQRECDQFSEFLLISLFYESIMGCVAYGWADDPVYFSEVEQTFAPAGFRGSYWFMRPVRFYEGPDILLNTSHADGFLWVAFRNESAIEQLSDELRAALNIERP
jgi:uncharacterized protein (TIGR02996 family)